MKSLTYGELPSEEEFSEAFDVVCPDGLFEFGNDERVGSTTLSGSELWEELKNACSEWDKYSDIVAGDWCSSVLTVLGFEWI